MLKNNIHSNKYITFSELRPSSLLRDARSSLRVSRAFPLHDWVKVSVVEYFVRYLGETRRRVIILEDEDDFFCLLPYRHRFSNVNEVIQRFNDVFNRASLRYRIGVWLTLTFNPKDLEKMDYLSYRYYAMECLNRFLSWLRKRFRGRDWSYICVIEFMDNGLIHFHVVVFGLRRIDDAYVFMKRLVSWGFGYIHYMYVIVNDNGVWRPKHRVNVENCDGGGVSKDYIVVSRIGLRNYLAKYMSKMLKEIDNINSILSNGGTLDFNISVSQTALRSGISQNSYSSSLNGNIASATTSISNLWKPALYWALRLRFFTCSRDLLISKNRIRVMRYHFVGVLVVDRYILYNNYYHDWLENQMFLCVDIVSATELMF